MRTYRVKYTRKGEKHGIPVNAPNLLHAFLLIRNILTECREKFKITMVVRLKPDDEEMIHNETGLSEADFS